MILNMNRPGNKIPLGFRMPFRIFLERKVSKQAVIRAEVALIRSDLCVFFVEIPLFYINNERSHQHLHVKAMSKTKHQ